MYEVGERFTRGEDGTPMAQEVVERDAGVAFLPRCVDFLAVLSTEPHIFAFYGPRKKVLLTDDALVAFHVGFLLASQRVARSHRRYLRRNIQ